MPHYGGIAVPVPAIEPRQAATPDPVTPEPGHYHASAASESPLLEQVRETCTAHRRADSRVTGTVLARELGLSDGYTRRLLRQLAIGGGRTA